MSSKKTVDLWLEWHTEALDEANRIFAARQAHEAPRAQLLIEWAAELRKSIRMTDRRGSPRQG